ncbi:MAG TPA: DUF1844 domain-containing protein [Candidatus Binatia bacterium]|jgi:hypothetical protein|nr:DUF1844 domain-containing protein [Candidatus Binatia bacterium]
MAEEAGKKGFKVEDRRRFTPETGEPRETSETAASESDADAKSKEEPQQEESSGQGPEISFSTFIISLSTQALMHLGEIPNPLSGKVEKDVSVAKQMIDIVAMLREKTHGNLDQGENKLVEDVLFDLRMRYVEAVKKK